mmetsp:Transcript_27455/g.35437  ORF Transcript_27455/g.35437 Transcript_27455/m.35437 type:complete len:344 (+) Transcript_27455:147-1178(+)
MAKRRLADMEQDDKLELLRKYLAPLSQEKILQLLMKIGAQNDYAFAEIENTAQQDPTHRKLFLRGVPWECTKELVQAAFQVFGEVEETNVVMDKQTGKTKGYGFVTYRTMESAYKALDQGSILLQGRQVFVNLAAVRTNPQQAAAESGQGDTTMRKIFVRGMNWNNTEEDMREFFSQWGEIEHLNILFDHVLNRSKGSGFVTYKKAASAAAALEEPQKEWNDRIVHCNLAALGAKKDPPAAQTQASNLLGAAPSNYSGLGSGLATTGLGVRSGAGGAGASNLLDTQAVGLGPAAQAMAIAAARRSSTSQNPGLAALLNQANTGAMYGGGLMGGTTNSYQQNWG